MTVDTMLHKELFNPIFSFSKFYNNTKSSVGIHQPRGAMVIIAIEKLENEIKKIIKNDYPPFTFHVSHCIGRPSLSRVLWISVTLNRTRVSSSPSYSICFGRKGDGFVHGVMLSALGNHTTLIPTYRTTLEKFIDVDGNTDPLRYNNKFINPQDVYSDLYNEETAIIHLHNSLDLLQKLSN